MNEKKHSRKSNTKIISSFGNVSGYGIGVNSVRLNEKLMAKGSGSGGGGCCCCCCCCCCCGGSSDIESK